MQAQGADETGRGGRKPVFDLELSETGGPLPQADVYVFGNPVFAAALEFARALPPYGRGLVVDLDDDILDPPLGNPAYWGTNPRNAKARDAGIDRSLLPALLDRADVVTVATPALQAKYLEFAPDVRVLRNRLDWEMFTDVEPAYERERERVRVGWYGTLAWRKSDLDVLRGVIAPWLEQNPHVDFAVIGPKPEDTHDYLGVPAGQRMSFPGWRDLKDLVPVLGEIDVGVVPLHESFFNECKSALKGMEFNAAGVPVIASPTGEYERWLDGGVGGFTARTPAEWRGYLDLLTKDHIIRRDLGRLARDRAQQHTIQEHRHEWVTAWSDAFTRGVMVCAMGFGALQQPDELDRFLKLAFEQQPRVIVEIGSGAGGTLVAWRRLFPDAKIISIDLPGGRFGGHLQLQVPPGVVLIDGDSHETDTKLRLLAELGQDRIDLLFVDGDHTYAGVKADWEMYGPLARTVAFHDIVFHDPDLLAANAAAEDVDAIKAVYADVDVHTFWRELDHPGKLELVADGKWGGIGIIEQELEERQAAA